MKEAFIMYYSKRIDWDFTTIVSNGYAHGLCIVLDFRLALLLQATQRACKCDTNETKEHISTRN